MKKKTLLEAMRAEIAENKEHAENWANMATACLRRGDYGGAATYSQRASTAYLVAHRIQITIETWDAEGGPY